MVTSGSVNNGRQSRDYGINAIDPKLLP